MHNRELLAYATYHMICITEDVEQTTEHSLMTTENFCAYDRSREKKIDLHWEFSSIIRCCR